MDGGLIGKVLEGDPIAIDIPARTISLKVSEDELANRKFAPQPERNLKGVLARYARQAGKASEGAGMEIG